MKPWLTLIGILLVALSATAWLTGCAADDDDDDAGETAADDDDTEPEDGNCPPGFRYFAGGWFTAVREGERWPNGLYAYDVQLAPFCLAAYECSQPTATDASAGAYDPFDTTALPPPAQVARGVIPWHTLSWYDALLAVHQQGWRLPTFEELQYVAAGADGSRLWIYGAEWDCAQAESSWFEKCDGSHDLVDGPGAAGGPTGASDYGLGVYDLLGNLTEATSTPWDMDCYGVARFTNFGGAFGGLHQMQNEVTADAEAPGCWLTENFAKHARGEHEHPATDIFPFDDGFRAAADPGEQWRDWEPATEAVAVTEMIDAWYYDPWTSERVAYQIDPAAREQGTTTFKQYLATLH